MIVFIFFSQSHICLHMPQNTVSSIKVHTLVTYSKFPFDRVPSFWSTWFKTAHTFDKIFVSTVDIRWNWEISSRIKANNQKTWNSSTDYVDDLSWFRLAYRGSAAWNMKFVSSAIGMHSHIFQLWVFHFRYQDWVLPFLSFAMW